MKKKFFILIMTIAMFLLIGCECLNQVEAKEQMPDNKFMEFIEYASDNTDIEEWRDTETGVHYFIYSESVYKGGCGGICPRYNADGTLYVD